MSKKIHILIVEDNPYDYDLAQREIQKSLNSSVFKRVATVNDYLAALTSFQPDLILSDYSLGSFDGMKALQLAQEHLPFTPLIIWTGSISEDVAAECMKAGAHNYVLKENVTRLVPAVLHALEEREMLLARKQADDKLSRSEMNYRALAENSLQGIAIFQEQKIVYVNSAMCTIMGYTAAELLALSQEQILALTHPEDRAIAQERAARRREGEALSDVNDVRIIRKDGTMRWIQTFANPVEYDGQPALLSTSIDITERKQAEEKLQMQEKHFRALIENSLDSISLLSADGVLLWENPAVERALGYEPGEFINRHIFELVHPDDLGWISDTFSQVAREPGSKQRGIFRLQHRDGTWRWVEGTATNMLQDPSVQAIVINYRDITKRKNAEQELKESQSRYRSLVETSHDLIWAVDAEGRFTFVNAAAKAIYGYEPDELIGRFYFSVMDPEYGRLTPGSFQESISAQTGFHEYEVYVRHRDGRQIVLSANSIVLRDDDGRVIGMSGTSRDITEQKRAQEALRTERNLLRTLIDHLPDYVYAMDKQGRKTLSNTADWQASGGKTMEDVIGKTDFDLYPPELAEQFWQVGREVLESGQPVINYEEPGLGAEGQRVSVLTSKIPLRDESGNVIGLVGIGRNITERKKVEAQIRDLHSFNEKLLDESPLGILAYKLTGECIYANARAAAMIGATVESLKAQNFHTIESWKTSGLYALAEQAISSQTLAQSDIHLISTFGREVWMAVRCVLFQSNEEPHLLLSMSEITERKLAEEALRENEHRYRTLFEDMPIAIWEEDFSAVKAHLESLKAQGITDLRAYLNSHPEQVKACDDLQRILDVNHAAVEMYRAGTKERLIRETMQETSRGEQEHLIEDLLAIAEGRTSNSWEGADETCDGTSLEIQMTWSVVPGYERDFSKVIVTTIDVTEKRRVQQAEREQRTLAEALRDTAQLLNSTLDYGEVLDHILSAVERVVPHDAGTIMLIEDGFARVVRSHGYDKFGDSNEIVGIRLPLAETTNLRQMLETRQPVIVYDTHAYPGWKRTEVTGWLLSSVGAPILIQGEVIGFIALDSEMSGFFSPVHAERLESFANQAALAIYNARLLQQAREEITERRRTEIELHHKNEDLRLLNVINNAVVRGQDLDSIIDLLARELKRIFSAVGSTVYMLAADKRSLTMQQYSFSPETEKRIEKLLGFGIPKIEIPIKEGGHFHNALLTKQSLVTTDPQKIQDWIAEFTETKFLPPIAKMAARKLIPHIYKLLKIRSTITVPLISQEDVIGFLDVSSAGFLTSTEMKRIETIAEQLTSLIQRQQVSEKVRKSEEFLQGIQNSLSAHVVILDQDGTIVQVNEAWREFGDQNGLRNPDYCIGMNYFSVCEFANGPDDQIAKEIASAIRRVLSGQTSEASIEYPAHSPTEKRWFIVHITCFDDGRQKWVILAHENITERVKAEKASIESAAQFRTLFEASPDAIVLIDPVGNWPIIDCNSAAAKMNGYTREELIGQSIQILNTEPATPEVYQASLEHIQQAGVLRYETIHVHKDGTQFPIEVSTTLIQLGERNVVLGIDRDITERKLIEEELQQSESRYRTVVENQTEFIVRWKADGTRTFVNDAYCRYYGVTAEQALDADFMSLIHEDDRQMVQEKLTLLLSGISSVETDSRRVFKPDGSVGWNEWTDQAIYDEDGQLLEFQSIGRDITERKLAESALQQSQARYQDLFDKSPISLWEEDYSLVKQRIDELRKDGVTDFGEYFDSHPEQIIELAYQVRIIDVNTAALELYHARQKEDLLQNLAILLGENWRLHVQQEILGLLSPIKGFVWEGSDKTLDGQAMDVIVTGTIPSGSEEDWSRVIVSIVDITERKQAERELRKEQQRAQNYLDIAGVMILALDLEGNVSMINQKGCEILGCSSNEIVGQNWINTFIPDSMRADMWDVFQNLIHEGLEAAAYYENPVLTKGGEQRMIAWHNTLVRDKDGRVITSLSSGEDITERKRAENELRVSEERFRQLAGNIEEVFWMTEVDTGRELYASPAMEKIWGLSVETLLRVPNAFLQTVLPEDRSIVLSGIEKEKAGEKVEMEYRIVHSDGSVHWIWDRAFPIFDESNRVKILAGISADITQRKQSELEIHRHLAELEALYENGLAIGRLLEPKEIGNQIIETFARHLSWHHVAIRLLNPATDALELIAFNQPGLSDEARAAVEMRLAAMVSKIGQGLSGWAMQTGKPIRTGNVHSHPQYVDTQRGIMSGLYMPLAAGEHVIGCISVESDQPDAFSVQDERLLATLANQAAIAFENARLYQSTQQELIERKRAQQALWASETHYRQLADSITDILFELDQDLRYTHWNKASEMFSGIPAEDIVGKSMHEIQSTGIDIFQRPEIYKSVMKERQAKIFEINASTLGQKRSLEISAYPSVSGVSVVARDVTERKSFEALLQKRVELIEYAANHSLDDVMKKLVDEVSALTESHIGFMHIVEADETTISLQMWSTETIERYCRVDGAETKLHYPLDQAGIWADAVRQRRPVIHDDYSAIPNKQGQLEGHVELKREMILPVIRNDKIVAVIGVGNKEQQYTQQDIEVATRFADYAWDITERRRIESELVEERHQLARRVEARTADLSRANSNLARALRVKDEFLANMSHELRTPLNAILGLSESLSEQVAGPLNEKQSRYLSTINESGHHLLSLINDILDLAKIEAGQITLDINKVDISSVCQASLRMIKQLAQKKNQDVSFEIGPNLGLMWADERRLKQMIVNLLSNAVKFTPESGKIGLEVQGDEDANIVSITVWDEGIGISDSDIHRLFRPFVQLDAGLAREATGTGLGLALVAQMAQLHGGSVIVDSRPGNGSSFTIRLPWQPAMAGETMARLKSTGKFRAVKPGEVRPTVLLIEDTQEVVMMLVDYLEMAGFNMVTAQDGIDGLTQARIAHPDLILMDIQMPRMDGFETTEKLRSDPEFKDTPIIALTALAMPNDRQRCMDAGMNEYLSKPVNLKALSKTIKAFLFESESSQP